MVNLTVGFDEIAHKLEVLAKHCSDVGRDPAAISTTAIGQLFLGETMDDATAKLSELLAARGMPPWDQLDDSFKTALGSRFIIGGPDEVGDRIQQMVALGLDGVTLSLPADGHLTDSVAFAGQVISKALA
jgi:alkanesulfonate monooxygenase SsuD/methylene tetrahydromethanopterin reductase-like flavin-dependent oxidoreductase (luciferase family)